MQAETERRGRLVSTRPLCCVTYSTTENGDVQVDELLFNVIYVPMTKESKLIDTAFWRSAFTGALFGTVLQILLAVWGEPVDKLELWGLPLIILAYSLFAVPFVALGLAVFALPVTPLLRGYEREWWVLILAATLGGAAGKAMFFAIDHVMFFGYYDISKIDLHDIGVIFGTPTGLAWWFFYRREHSRL